MNYLAHAYLSFGISDIATGNLISDFVKGKKKLDYPETIQHGITLHRAIDTFTDGHPITQEAKLFFRHHFGLYSGPITDIVYDPFYARLFKSEMNYAWPDDNGNMRGLAIQPLYPSVVKAVKQDELLYKSLASIDIIRVGRTRELKVAIEELQKIIL